LEPQAGIGYSRASKRLGVQMTAPTTYEPSVPLKVLARLDFLRDQLSARVRQRAVCLSHRAEREAVTSSDIRAAAAGFPCAVPYGGTPRR